MTSSGLVLVPKLQVVISFTLCHSSCCFSNGGRQQQFGVGPFCNAGNHQSMIEQKAYFGQSAGPIWGQIMGPCSQEKRGIFLTENQGGKKLKTGVSGPPDPPAVMTLRGLHV